LRDVVVGQQELRKHTWSDRFNRSGDEIQIRNLAPLARSAVTRQGEFDRDPASDRDAFQLDVGEQPAEAVSEPVQCCGREAERHSGVSSTLRSGI
jgi:hypothetical protein